MVKKLVLAMTTPFLFLLVLEQVLEVIGFETHFPGIVFKGEKKEVTGMHGMIRDDALLWKFSPGGVSRETRINSLGFRDREVAWEKPPGMVRVICMGDSITADGPPSYANCLHQILQGSSLTDQKWEAFNMGVYGYSSVQGLRLFQIKGRKLSPDYVTLYFGWNDHWICGFIPDSRMIARRSDSRLKAFAFNVLRRKRFGQLLVVGLSPLEKNRAVLALKGNIPKELTHSLRVPPDEYRAVLTRFVKEIRSVGAVPILITAPRGPSISPIFVHNGQAESLDKLIEHHRRYVGITREVAAATGAELLDLAEIMEKKEHSALFNRDGVHLTQEGLWFLGRRLYEKLRRIIDEDQGRASEP